MNKEEICKVTIEGGIYKVNAMVDDEKKVHFYRVMRGRNIAKGGSYFNDKRAAVMFMLRIAFNDVAQLSFEGLL